MSHGEQHVLPGAGIATGGYVVLVDAGVAVVAVGNGIGYVWVRAVLEGKAE